MENREKYLQKCGVAVKGVLSMREILFRAKSIDEGKWVEGYYCPVAYTRFPCESSIIPKDDMDDGYWHSERIIPETLGQFTGLIDKNGTKIFEGDIVKDEYILGKVVYNTKQEDFDGAASFMIDDVDDGLQSYRFWNSVEVIGNIHDNPELLGGADKA